MELVDTLNPKKVFVVGVACSSGKVAPRVQISSTKTKVEVRSEIAKT